jgi:hypothetical protein
MTQKKEQSALFGLPIDLLEPEGKSIVLIRRLPAKALNRDLKRKLVEHPSSLSDLTRNMI